MRKSVTGALLATALALGLVVGSPVAASAALTPACTGAHEFEEWRSDSPNEFELSTETYLCTRYEDGNLYISAVADKIKLLGASVTFRGNIVVTRDGATVSTRQFSRSSNGSPQKLDILATLPIVVPGDYQVVMDGHLLVKNKSGQQVGSFVVPVTSLRVPIAL